MVEERQGATKDDTTTKRQMDEKSGPFLSLPRSAYLPERRWWCASFYLWLVGGGEHGHLHVLSADWFGLARGRGPGGLLVVAAHTNEEEKQGDGQRDRHAGNQDVQDLHVAAT